MTSSTLTPLSKRNAGYHNDIYLSILPLPSSTSSPNRANILLNVSLTFLRSSLLKPPILGNLITRGKRFPARYRRIGYRLEIEKL